jgi:hypothetical protein
VNPLALADIGVFATVDYIETEVDAAQASLQVFIDGSKLKFLEEAGKHRFSLEMISLIFDSSGQSVKTDSTSIQSALLPQALIARSSRAFAIHAELSSNRAPTRFALEFAKPRRIAWEQLRRGSRCQQ